MKLLVNSLVVGARCLALTCRYCVHIIYLSMRGRLTRQQVDVFARSWADYILTSLRITYDVEGLDTLRFEDNTPYIFMSNHVSLFDIIVANAALPPSIRFLAKKELSYYPLLGRAMRAGEYIFIDRRNLPQALKDLERAKQKLQSGVKLWIFPEGTRARVANVLLPFKKGGFHLAVDIKAKIVPVALCGTERIVNGRLPLARFDQHLSVRVGTPIDAAAFGKENLAQLIACTEQSIAHLIEHAETRRH